MSVHILLRLNLLLINLSNLSPKNSQQFIPRNLEKQNKKREAAFIFHYNQ